MQGELEAVCELILILAFSSSGSLHSPDRNNTCPINVPLRGALKENLQGELRCPLRILAVISYLLRQPLDTGFSVEFRGVGLSGVLAAMGPFLERWRRIGTRLYLALGIAVILTLISGAVGVFYFEQSGDLNYQVRNESVPALEASWTVARETERLRNLGLGLAAEPDLGFQGLARGTVVDSLERLDSALNVVSCSRAIGGGAGCERCGIRLSRCD